MLHADERNSYSTISLEPIGPFSPSHSITQHEAAAHTGAFLYLHIAYLHLVDYGWLNDMTKWNARQ